MVDIVTPFPKPNRALLTQFQSAPVRRDHQRPTSHGSQLPLAIRHTRIGIAASAEHAGIPAAIKTGAESQTSSAA
jgi:hypothetical protein